MEVLDADRPPSAFARRVESLLDHRGAKGAAGVGVAVLLLGGWSLLAPDEAPEVAQQGADPADMGWGPMPPPAPESEERPARAGPWRIVDELTISASKQGRLITFTAVNGADIPRDPRALQVEAGYPGGLASSYAFGCVGGERTARGFERLDGPVQPGEEVVVRCPDTVRLNGQPARLPPEELNVVLQPRGA